MVNFRYHIVSLIAVFVALCLGGCPGCRAAAIAYFFRFDARYLDGLVK